MTFIDFCRLLGITIDREPPLGVWRRYKTADKPHKRNGAVKWMGDHGFAQNHATMDKPDSWRSEGEYKITPIDLKKLEAAKSQARQRKQEAQRGVQALWQASSPLVSHAYFDRKGIGRMGTMAMRVWRGKAWASAEHIEDEWIVVPMFDAEHRMRNVQRISTRGHKTFFPAAQVTGCYHILERRGAPLTVFAEGLSTALALFQCVRTARVVCCFNAGNLPAVVEAMKPTGSVVIAADNDHKTAAAGTYRGGLNPGIEKAKEAAAIVGAGVVWPEGIEGSDFADLWKEWGTGSERRIERLVMGGAKLVRKLEIA